MVLVVTTAILLEVQKVTQLAEEHTQEITASIRMLVKLAAAIRTQTVHNTLRILDVALIQLGKILFHTEVLIRIPLKEMAGVITAVVMDDKFVELRNGRQRPTVVNATHGALNPTY